MVENDSRSPLSVGVEWAAKISSLGLGMGLPVLLGYFIDTKLGSRPVGLLSGSILGFLVLMVNILKLARQTPRG